MYGIIYKATSPTGKVYIGQTTETLAIRKSKHKYMTLKGNLRFAFQVALLELGFDNFTWDEIDSAENQEDLDRKEKQWIAHYKADDPEHGYNITGGGIKYNHSPETRRKISVSQKGKVMGAEFCRKISEAMKGKKNRLGKRQNEETRKKIGEANKRRTVTKETRRKMSRSQILRKTHPKGSQNGKTKIKEETVIAIKKDFINGLRCSKIAAKYGLEYNTVRAIKTGKSWAWLQI